MLSPTGLIPWFSKAEGNTYSTLLHHPFLFKEKTNASSRSSKKDFWRRCRGDLRQAKTYQVPIINSHPTHYIICHSPLIFLSPTSKMIFEKICISFALLFVPFSMAEPRRASGFLPGSSALDNPSVLSKLINNDALEKLTGIVEEDFNLDEDDPGIFRYLLDESLKDSWDGLLRIRASYVPQYQIEVYLKSFYFGLPPSFKQVLDSIFENGFLGGDAIDTYEKMKSIFGHPKEKDVESSAIMSFYQNEIIKEMKASLDANFRNVLNLSSTINGHVLSQNRKINAIDKKFSLFFPNAKDDNT